MAVRSRIIIPPSVVPVAPATVSFTVPAGRSAILRAITLTFSGTVGTADVRSSIVPLSGGGGEWWRASMPSPSSVLFPYVTLDHGDTIYFSLGSAPATGTVRVAAFGSLLLGVWS